MEGPEPRRAQLGLAVSPSTRLPPHLLHLLTSGPSQGVASWTPSSSLKLSYPLCFQV